MRKHECYGRQLCECEDLSCSQVREMRRYLKSTAERAKLADPGHTSPAMEALSASAASTKERAVSITGALAMSRRPLSPESLRYLTLWFPTLTRVLQHFPLRHHPLRTCKICGILSICWSKYLIYLLLLV
jgi:hypothetical protein